MIQPFHADLFSCALAHRFLDKVSRLVAEQPVNPAYKLILWLRAELRLSVESPAQEPVGIFDCDDAASYDLSAEWVAFTDVFDVKMCIRDRVHSPGGCTIGARPIDLHLKGFEALGAEIIVKDNYVEAVAGEEGLIGSSIYLDFPSVGATENIMTADVYKRQLQLDIELRRCMYRIGGRLRSEYASIRRVTVGIPPL